ncbi:sulfur carrier protein ThiS [Bacillota bacterium Lsc_1132]
MIIKIGGENKEVKDSVTVSELLVLEKVEQPDMVSVQLNEEFVDREQYETTVLKQGDEIDFLYFMGGGTFDF